MSFVFHYEMNKRSYISKHHEVPKKRKGLWVLDATPFQGGERGDGIPKTKTKTFSVNLCSLGSVFCLIRKPFRENGNRKIIINH